MKTLLAILLALPLLSVAPVPTAQPTVYWTRLTIVQSPQQQACTFEIATARLQQQIDDPIGYPYGMVRAFSCAGDAQAVIAELESRAAAMQAEARAYREQHPIGGAK
jgi:hypothetical protein